MRTRSKLLPILMSLALAVSLCPAPALAANLTTASAGLTVQKAGTDDYPYKNASTSATDRWNFIARQCTSFVAWRLNNDNGLAFTNQYLGGAKSGATAGRWSHAKYWGTVARSRGIAVDMNPAPGSVAWTTAGDHGHVAWVQSVSGNSVTIEEYNWSPAYKYNRRTVDKSKFNGFIHFKDLSDPYKVTYPEPGYYTIQSHAGWRVLDIEGGGSAQNTNMKLFHPIDNSGQVFYIGRNDLGYYIKHYTQEMFVGALNNSSGNANAVLQRGDGSNGQNGTFYDAGGGYVYFANKWGKFLDLDNGVDEDHRNVQFFDRNGSDAQKWKLVRVSGKTRMDVELGSYAIQSAVGSKVLDVEGGVEKHGTNVKIYHPIDNNGQVFQVGWNSVLAANNIAMKSCGKWVGTLNNANGQASSILQDGDGSHGQNWFFEDAGGGYVYIRNLWGYYLDVDNGKDEDSRNVQVFPFNGSTAQKWKLVKVSGNTRTAVKHGGYNVKSMVGNKVLTLTGGSTADGTAVEIRTPNGSGSQLFNVAQPDNNPWLFIKLPSVEKFVGAKGNANGMAACVVQPGDGSNGQNWFFEDAGGGCYYIRDLWGYYLDVVNGKDADGQGVQTHAFNGSDAQKWKLVAPASSGSGQPTRGGSGAAGKTAIGSAAVTNVKSKTYTGKALTQSPTVKVNGKALKAGTDYELAYSDNVKAGTATMTVKGKGSYTGAKRVKFTIAKADVKGATAAKVKAQKYRKGKAIKPSPKLAYKGKTLKKGADYTLSYKNNKKRGTATITVKGKGNFKGTKTIKFKIK